MGQLECVGLCEVEIDLDSLSCGLRKKLIISYRSGNLLVKYRSVSQR